MPSGTLRVHLEAEPPHLNPLLDSLEVLDRVTRGLVHDSLIECTGGGYLPGLAERWEVDVGPRRNQILLQLRPNLRWHDGAPVTTMDAQASLEVVLRSTSRLVVTRAGLADVSGVEVLPDRTVRLRLARPAPAGVLRALCDVPIVPERLARGSRDERARLGRHPIGTGPFRFAEWQPGRHILLEAHPGGWRGPPGLAALRFDIEPDPVAALNGLRRGRLDLLPQVLELHYPDQVTAAALGPALRALRVDEPRVSLVLLDARQPHLQRAEVREALDRLLDRGRLAGELHRGLASPTSSWLPDAPTPPELDPAGAAALLERAGYHDTDRDRVRERDGQPLRLRLLHAEGASHAAQAGRRFAEDAAAAGVRLEVQALAPEALREKLRRGDFDLALVGWRGRPEDDPRPLIAGAGRGAALAPDLLQGPLDALVAATSAADEAVARVHLARAVAQARPILGLFRHHRITVLTRRLQGVCQDGLDLDLRKAWLSP